MKGADVSYAAVNPLGWVDLDFGPHKLGLMVYNPPIPQSSLDTLAILGFKRCDRAPMHCVS
jgi:hypothetical protein